MNSDNNRNRHSTNPTVPNNNSTSNNSRTNYDNNRKRSSDNNRIDTQRDRY